LIAGIDLATKTGFAVLQGPQLIAYGTIKIDGHSDVTDLVTQLLAHGVKSAAIENVFCGPNVQTAIMLATLRGRLVQELDRAGIAWELVAPSTWRKATFKPKPKTKRKELKSGAINYVSDKYGPLVKEDEADAILIAEWAVSHISDC
jgi:Holliday junction resolvasome RuvABC endonuclease subunit